MSTMVSIDPRVLLAELRAKADYLENRCLLLAQEAFAQRETIKALEAEIAKLKGASAAGPEKKKA
jgi:hypothetical protein